MNNNLLELLQNHLGYNAIEQKMTKETLAFIQKYPISKTPNCFHRALSIGHITASTWVTDAAVKQALFTHHKKIGKWLQLGGHCDGNPNVVEVALTEAREESGLNDFQLKQSNIFDVDIHLIPTHKTIAAHYHYDIRFWLIADAKAPLKISSESKDLKWLPIDKIKKYNNEASIMRMVEKCITNKI